MPFGDAGLRSREFRPDQGNTLVYKIAGGAMNLGAGGGRLSGVDGLKLCGQRHERQLVAMHGGKPQELELREENECCRDRTRNRFAVQTSHG